MRTFEKDIDYSMYFELQRKTAQLTGITLLITGDDFSELVDEVRNDIFCLINSLSSEIRDLSAKVLM